VSEHTPDQYVIAHVRDGLATDPRVVELGIDVEVANGSLVLLGRVGSSELRDAAAEVAAELAPGYAIRNELEVVDLTSPPAAPEQLR
jgi:osmotically-inducible protein OsmY